MTKRRVLIRLGRRGDFAKAVDDARARRVIAYYRDAGGRPQKQSFPFTEAGRKEARAFVEGWHAHRNQEAKTPELTLTTAQLWARYAAAELDGLRGATIINYKYHWRRWEVWIGRDRRASTVTVEDCARFRAEVLAKGGSLNQARQTLAIVRGVYRWGVAARIVRDQGVLAFRWKRRKDDPLPLAPNEYTAADIDALLRAVDRDDSRQWKAWVFLMLASHHGQRANAVFHLRWSDIDWSAGVVHWRREYQKQGKALVRPLSWEIVSALITAEQWRARAATVRVRAHHTGAADPARLALADWILFAERDKSRPMSYTSLHWHLTQAEQRAGVAHQGYRAAHGIRRYLVGEIIERTGDRMLGLEAVGDTDPKMLRSYDKRLEKRVTEAFDSLNSVPQVSPEHAAENAFVTDGMPTPDITKD